MTEDMLKLAYAQGYALALEEEGLEKTAFWGGALSLGRRLLLGATKPGATGWGKVMGEGGLLGREGLLRKGYLGDAFQFGLLGGGLNAIGADEGQRMSAFGKGFGLGAIGGAGWRLGGQLGTGAMKRMATGPLGGTQFGQRMQRVMGVGKPGAAGKMTFFGGPEATSIYKMQGVSAGEKAKIYGTKALTGGIAGLAVPIAVSGQVEGAAEKHIPWLQGAHDQMLPSGMRAPTMGLGREAARAMLRGGHVGLVPGTTPGTMPGSM